MMVTPNFHFKGDCIKAIELYKKVFNMEIVHILTNNEANPEDFISNEENLFQVYHAEAMLFGTRIMMTDVSEKDYVISSNPLSLAITYDTAEQVKNAFDLIKDGAKVLLPLQSTTYSSAFVSLIDKFGMRWELMTEQVEK